VKRRPQYLLFDGELVPYEDARLHVLSTTLKYGVGAFEGYRAYWHAGDEELYAFRIDDHMRRLVGSMAILGIDGPSDMHALTDDLLGLIRANELREDLHLRVQVFVTADDGTPEATGPALVSMAAMPMGRYFDRAALDVCVSSWTRIDERSMPPRVKAIANYQNSRLALQEAVRDGYDSALLLTHAGTVSEGPGFNVFIVRGGRLATPPTTDGILEGITRDSVLTLAREHLGLEVDERPIDRTELYLADEVFVCGSAAEVTPVASVDRHVLHGGDVARSLQDAYRRAARGELGRERGWAVPVYARAAA
jgi:branched-chain amino acid aminotransferase